MKQVQYFDKKGNLQFSCLFYYSFMAKLFAKTVKLFGATRIEIINTDMDMREMTVADIFVERYHDKLLKNDADNKDDEKKIVVHKIIRLTDIPELTDDMLIKAVNIYMDSETIDDAEKNFNKYIDTIVPDVEVDYKKYNGFAEAEKSDEYKKHEYARDVKYLLHDIQRMIYLDEKWVEKHGKRHTDEEAAKIAAEKVMEVCFGWHLQDNGALNEEHSFMASILATSLGNDAKKDISEEVKQKAYDLCYGYFLGHLKYVETLNKHDYLHMDDYRNWLKENIPSDNTERFNWEYIYGRLDCDYDPSYPWYLIFLNAGMKESEIRLICPWKTGISIRNIDNAVRYRTYSNVEYL